MIVAESNANVCVTLLNSTSTVTFKQSISLQHLHNTKLHLNLEKTVYRVKMFGFRWISVIHW